MEEVDIFVVARVLTVTNAGAGRGHLDVASTKDLLVVQAVLVDKLALDDVGKDLEFAMRMSAEAGCLSDSIFVDYP